eukprot:4874164-Alexandrium_andersonii.AAC.1
MPATSIAQASSVAGHRGRARGSRAVTCCSSHTARRRLASSEPVTPRSSSAREAAWRLPADGRACGRDGAGSAPS